ncbi:putative membrane protein YeiH [Glaciihabitans tibetensis]|uniref:Putative membrane protein YeiH n=1 Tax=Glaciihabitans tibetensis TaxID=1266600 RepID=A0A2T0VJ46_9MICO|nr:putative membrane protein YeiH [Glaciihabitans tibetensis]
MISAAFVIPFWADILAIGIGALQGALFAAQYRDRRLDLLGVAIVGIASGFGGGLIRDILLSEVPAAMQSNWYLPVAVAAALLGMLLERVFSRLNALITALDALTIGLFGVIGTTKALSLGVPEVPAVFVGVVSAVGGSILRDILLNTPIALMHVGSLYAVAALFGCVTLVGLAIAGVPVIVAAIASVVVTFGVRILAVLFNWSLPEQRRLERIPRLPRIPRIARFPRSSKDRNAAARAGSPRTGAIPRVGPSTQTGSIARVSAGPTTGSIPRVTNAQPRTGSIPKQAPATRPASTARLPRGLRRKP